METKKFDELIPDKVCEITGKQLNQIAVDAYATGYTQAIKDMRDILKQNLDKIFERIESGDTPIKVKIAEDEKPEPPHA